MSDIPVAVYEADTVHVDVESIDAAAFALGEALLAADLGLSDTVSGDSLGNTPDVTGPLARQVLGYLAFKRTQWIDAGQTTIPVAMSDEDGDRWWVHGHVSPEAMVLAVVLCTATELGNPEAIELLTGGDFADGIKVDDKIANANSMLTRVAHVWYVDTGSENSPLVAPGTPGAEPLTVLSL